MSVNLVTFFQNFQLFNEEEIAELVQNIPVKELKKGTLLLKEGEISRSCYFVLDGCVRKYYLKDGKEKTTDFFSQGQAVNSTSSYLEQKPSKHYFECIEDSILIIGESGKEEEMFKKIPKLESLARTMVEEDYGKTQDKFDSFITSSPEERYLNLLENRPDLLHRVPQHQIASYLGMTPESLSRIRKRISLKNKP